MEDKIQDYGKQFEDILEKIFGTPKTAEYFSNYYGINNDEDKYILFTVCVYLLNWKDISIEEKKVLENYLRDKKYLDDNEFHKMLEYLVQKLLKE